jgi:hypothetical protein
MVKLIHCLKGLFDFSNNLKILKISCDRSMPLQAFRNALDSHTPNTSHSPNARLIRSEVVGFDNHNYTIFLKKNERHTTRGKGGAVAKKSPKL